MSRPTLHISKPEAAQSAGRPANLITLAVTIGGEEFFLEASIPDAPGTVSVTDRNPRFLKERLQPGLHKLFGSVQWR